jgi:hypothetical protein
MDARGAIIWRLCCGKYAWSPLPCATEERGRLRDDDDEGPAERRDAADAPVFALAAAGVEE